MEVDLATSSCSGTFISNHGHILTALHCLGVSPYSSLVNQDYKDVGTVSRPTAELKTKNRSVQVMHNIVTGRFANYSDSAAHVLVTSKGFFETLDEFKAARKNPKVFAKLMQAGYGPSEDFLIVKVDLESTPCAPVRTSHLNPLDKVFSVGYIMSEAFLSFGSITRGFDDAAPNDRKIENWVTPAIIDLIRQLSANPRALYADLDVNYGSSGSGVFNSRGELVGLINAEENFGISNGDHYRPGIAYGTQAWHIRQTARVQLSAKDYADAFDCRPLASHF